jgi:hypothetical protein
MSAVYQAADVFKLENGRTILKVSDMYTCINHWLQLHISNFEIPKITTGHQHSRWVQY